MLRVLVLASYHMVKQENFTACDMQVCGLRSQTDPASFTEGRVQHNPFGKSVLLPQHTCACNIHQLNTLVVNAVPTLADKVHSVLVDSSIA